MTGTAVAFTSPGRVAIAARKREEDMLLKVNDMLLNVTTRVFHSFRRNEDGQDLLDTPCSWR